MEGDELQSRFLVSVVDPTNVWGLLSEVWSKPNKWEAVLEERLEC